MGLRKQSELIRMLKYTLLVGMNMSTVLNTLGNKYQCQNVPSNCNQEMIGDGDKDGVRKEKAFSSNLLGSLTEALQIKPTNDRLTTEKVYFIWMGGTSQRNNMKTPKKPLGLRAYISFLNRE